MRHRTQQTSNLTYIEANPGSQNVEFRDSLGNWCTIQFYNNETSQYHLTPGSTSTDMWDEVSEQLKRKIQDLRTQCGLELASIRKRRNVLVAAFRSDLHRQLHTAVHSLQSYIAMTRGREPKWIHVHFAKREDYEDTKVPQWLLDGLFAAAKAQMKINRQVYWALLFSDVYNSSQLKREPGERYKRIPFRDNKFRKVVRRTQQLYRERLALESKPGYAGPRFVTIELKEVLETLKVARETEKQIWDDIKAINAAVLNELNALSLKRTLWFADRRKQIRLRKEVIRFIRQQSGRQLALIYTAFNSSLESVRTYYETKIASLKKSFKVDDYHFLLKLQAPDRDIPQAAQWPGRVYGIRRITPHPVLDDPYRFSLGDALSVSAIPVAAHVEEEEPVPKGDLDFPLLPADGTRGEVLAGVGEALGRLYAGDPPRNGTNWLTNIVELRDLPDSFRNLKSFFTWARRSYRQQTLKGASFRSVAEAYLEHTYGIAPTVAFGALFMSQIDSLVEWLTQMINLASVDVSTKTVSQSFKHGALMGELNTDPITFTAKFKRRMFSYQRIDSRTGKVEPVMRVPPPHGGGSYASQYWTVEGTNVFWHAILGLGGNSERWKAERPYDAIEYPDYEGEPEFYERPAYDEVSDLYKVFTRPVPELKRSLGNEIRNLLWDNSLAETVWNMIPFSFMADWFLGIQDLMRGLDQLFVVGWQGSLRYLQPWLRRVKEVERYVMSPTVMLGTPSISEKQTIRTFWAGEPNVLGHLATVEVPITILRTFTHWRRWSAVRRSELPDDGTFYLVEAFKRRVRNSVRLKLNSGRRIFSISKQVLALGEANDVGDALMRDLGLKAKPTPRPLSPVAKGSRQVKQATKPMMTMQEMRRILESSGFVFR